MDILANYTKIKDLRSGGEGKAILLKKENQLYICKQRIFDSINEATAGLNEAYALASVNHPNVVKLEGVTVFEQDKMIYLCIIMEYCPKGDLADFLLDISGVFDTDPLSEHSMRSSSVGSSAKTSSSSLDELINALETEYISNTPSQTSSSNLSTLHSGQTTPIKSPKSDKRKTKDEKICTIKMTKDMTNYVSYDRKGNKVPMQSNEDEMTLLSNQIDRRGDTKYLIEQNQLCEWLLQLCYGVQALHKQHLIHRDLKSENIFISSNNTLKIGDFGLAYKTTSKAINAKGAVGTYLYSAPEVLEDQIYDKSADIFSLGCIFYELITLKNLCRERIYLAQEMIENKFDQMSFITSFPQKFQKLVPIVLKMLDKNPHLRPSIECIIDSLERMDKSQLKEKIWFRKSESTIHHFKGIHRQLDKEHFPEAAKVLANALADDPRFTSIFPPSDAYSLGHLTALFEFLLNTMSTYRASIWGSFTYDNKLVCVMTWFNPDQQKRIKFKDFVFGSFNFVRRFGIPRVKAVSGLISFVDSIFQSQKKAEKGKYWLLNYIATEEDYRGSSIATQLLDHILSIADHSNLKCKTYTFSNASHAFLQRNGFEVTSEITKENNKDIPKGIHHVWILERDPKPLV
ncbi:hypothetical protein CYY_001730 [Polysphondylium violaceum]|uniref:non-specific serine/threonine protein kinase n=1 Tax=Polysphondylium violaceum TaxID=133409 RepID=A0A8J4Q1A3_9MYCE|nr:hypothetical protein CYY_001730 [Polysphondylium violaceum]